MLYRRATSGARTMAMRLGRNSPNISSRRVTAGMAIAAPRPGTARSMRAKAKMDNPVLTMVLPIRMVDSSRVGLGQSRRRIRAAAASVTPLHVQHLVRIKRKQRHFGAGKERGEQRSGSG
jgi:hypothetical protein